jgi:hypothetical protein
MTAARFPEVPARRGHYESFYLRAADPAGGRSAWIRHTVHKRPGEAATGALWCTFFDAATPAPRAVKQSLPAPTAPAGDWLAIGDSRFGPGGAHGRAEAQGHSAAWELRFDGAGAAPLRHLPREWMYTAALPRTKVESPLPQALVSGWVESDGERATIDGWRGMAGHNWGAEHAERWIWLHGAGFDEAPDAWIDVALGRVRLGPLTTPWIANGAFCHGGESIRLGGLARRPRVTERSDGGELTLPGAGIEVAVAVRAAPAQLASWIYADPGGGEHRSTNCSIAGLELSVRRPGRALLRLSTAHGGAWELGTREPAPGVPVLPYPDP